MQKPKISICIPVYNTKEKFLRKAIENILEQSFSNFELIIVNDGSTNNAKDVILSYQDKRIQYFENPISSGGPAKARNIALSNAQGEYIFFHDHDDYLYTPYALEKMYVEAKENNLDILIFKTVDIVLIRGELTEMHPLFEYWAILPKSNIFDNKNQELLSVIFSPGLPPIWNKLFRLQFLKDNNLFFNENLIRSDDLEIFYRYILVADRIKVLYEPLYCWNRNSDSLLNKEFWDLVDIDLYNLIRKTLKDFGLYEKTKFDYLEAKLHYLEIFMKHTKPEDLCKFRNFLKISFKEDNLNYEEFTRLPKTAKVIFHILHGA